MWTAEAAMDRPSIARHVHDQRLLAESLDLLAPVAEDVVKSFYDQLFAEHPEVRSMFPAVMEDQHEKLLRAIIALVTHYDRPERLLPALTAMGRRHDAYAVRIDHYSVVGLTLLSTLRRYAGPAWTAEYEGAWLRAYTFAAGVMMQAGAAAYVEEGLAAA
jgi:methyl-accepting chemotaxis protein